MQIKYIFDYNKFISELYRNDRDILYKLTEEGLIRSVDYADFIKYISNFLKIQQQFSTLFLFF